MKNGKVKSINVYLFLVLRYFIAALIMLCVWNRQLINEIRSVPFRKYGIPGICMAFSFILINLALKYTVATNMSFIRSLSALIAPVLALIFYKQKYVKKEVILQFFILIGLYLLCAKGELSGFGFGEINSMMNMQIILILCYAAIGCTIGGYMLQNIALRHISAKQVGVAQCFYPIATAVFAFVMLNEKLSIPGIIGAIIITVCVVIENYTK